MTWYVPLLLLLRWAEGRRLEQAFNPGWAYNYPGWALQATVDPRCGDELCQSIDPASWCRDDNGVCQGHNTPCKCSGSATTQTTTSPASAATSDAVKDKYRAVSKALYVWNPGDVSNKWWDWKERDIKLLTSFCLAHNFTRAIVFIGSVLWDWEPYFQHKRLPHEDTFAELFQSLRSAGIVPNVAFYLNDNPNNLLGWEKAADIVDAVESFNQRYPGSTVEGIDGDQEPTRITEEYQNMNAHMLARKNQLGMHLPISAALKPGWLKSHYKERPMAAATLEHLDEGMIMAYQGEAKISMKLGDKALAQAASRLKRMSVAVEVSPRAPDSDTFWKMVSGPDKAAFFQMVVDMDTHYRTGEHSFFYHDFVIHDYEGLFEALYGVRANAYPADIVDALYH